VEVGGGRRKRLLSHGGAEGATGVGGATGAEGDGGAVCQKGAGPTAVRGGRSRGLLGRGRPGSAAAWRPGAGGRAAQGQGAGSSPPGGAGERSRRLLGRGRPGLAAFWRPGAGGSRDTGAGREVASSVPPCGACGRSRGCSAGVGGFRARAGRATQGQGAGSRPPGGAVKQGRRPGDAWREQRGGGREGNPSRWRLRDEGGAKT
jgi:hypothetical protein